VSLASPDIDVNDAPIQAALAALREGRTTGNAPLDQIVVALGRCRSRAWARFRGAWPEAPEAEVDAAADSALHGLVSVPGFVALLLKAEAATRAATGGDS